MGLTPEMVEERPRPLVVGPWDENSVAAPRNGKPMSGDVDRAGARQNRPATVVERRIIRQVHAGLQFLCDSHAQARELMRDPWEFAVEWSELQRLGLTCNDVRWLIHQGLVEHASEITGMEDSHRRFVPCSSLALSGRCCLIVTDAGIRFLRRAAEQGELAAEPDAKPSSPPEADDGKLGVVRVVPKWDRDRRQLRVGGRVVKEFKVPAPNQEIVLAVFEEEKWPPKIDDPLPHQAHIDPQRRLHDTINSLNRRQRHRLVHFGADGLGQGVRWEMLTKQLCREA